MDIGVGDAFDDVLSRWIRIGTSVAVVGISLVAWFGSSQQQKQQQGYDVGRLLRLKNENKKALRGLLVNWTAVEVKATPPTNCPAAKEEPGFARQVSEQLPPGAPGADHKAESEPGFARQVSEPLPPEHREHLQEPSSGLAKRSAVRFHEAEEERPQSREPEEPHQQPGLPRRGRSATMAGAVRRRGTVALEMGTAAIETANRAVRDWFFSNGKTPWQRLSLDTAKLKNKRPLLVFVNSRSGGGQGMQLLKELQTHLHWVQVVDLAKEKTPLQALKFWEATGLAYRILVCGGDGTVGWVLTVLEELQPEVAPPVAILPVGTGNDLARVMGWGGGFGGGSVLPELQKIQDAHPAYLDRWRVVFRDVPDVNRPGDLEPLAPRKQVMMCNYLGIGIDAAIALDFHLMRERSPHLFMSRLVNKVWYAKAGALSPYRSACLNLPERIEVWCDGEELEIPDGIEGIVVLNIPSFGGGCDLWNSDEADSDDEDSDSDREDSGMSALPTSPPRDVRQRSRTEFDREASLLRQSMQDKKMEVVGVHGSVQLGAAQVGLYSALRLKQASHIRIRNKAAIPVQVDGEPEMFAKNGEIDITFGSQALMLAHSESSSHAVATEVIEWGISKGHIAADKRNELMKFIAKSASKMKPSASSQMIS